MSGIRAIRNVKMSSNIKLATGIISRRNPAKIGPTIIIRKFIPLILLNFSFGTIVGTIALTVGRCIAWSVLRKVFIVIINHTFEIFRKNIKNKKNVTNAWKPSIKIRIFFRSNLSDNTPAIGVTIICGIKNKNDIIAKYTAFPVSTVIHHVITK